MKFFRSAAVLPMAVLTIFAVGPASATQSSPRSLEEVVQISDVIFTAAVAAKSSQFRNRNIITSYKMVVTDVWKGDVGASSGGTVTVELVGGSRQTPLRFQAG